MSVEEEQGGQSLVLVEALTFSATARWVRKALISASPSRLDAGLMEVDERLTQAR